MRRLRAWLLRLLGTFTSGQRERELAAELESNLALHIEDNIRSGLPPDEARRQALIRLGGVEQTKESYRERRGLPSLETLRQDVRYGFRMLRKNPGFTTLAVLTLALGIGANTTIFSWINSTLLNPIPGARQTSEVVSITRGGTVSEPGQFSYLDYLDLRAGSKSFSGLAVFAFRPLDLTGSGKPERLWAADVTANYFDVFRVRPVLGRGFVPAEDEKLNGAPVVVLNYGLWQRRFAGDTHIIGRTIFLNRHPFTVVGVAPADFQGTMTGLRTDLWVPVMMEQETAAGYDWIHDRGDNELMMQGRLKPGVSIDQSREELTLIMRHLAQQFPDSHFGANNVAIYPLWRAPNGANGPLYIVLFMLMAIAGVVLLLACANVANLLLVRSVSRKREIAIRLSIGAGRWRVMRQLLVESILLALAGGGAALLITTWTTGTLAEFIPPTGFPLSFAVRPDRIVLLVGLLISVLTGIVFGILPATRSAGLDPVTILKEETGGAAGGRRKSRLTGTLVTAQLALSLLLLVSAGLFIRAFRRAQQADPGFNPQHVLVASFDLFPAGYSRKQGQEFDRQLLGKLNTLPGVQSSSLAGTLPLSLVKDTEMVKIEDYVPQLREAMDIRSDAVGPDYLRTMQIPLVAGREFTVHDDENSQPVIMVNQALVDRYWPNQDAIGKRIWAQGHWSTVVGVTRNSKYDLLNEEARPFLYLPLFQDYTSHPTVLAHVSGDPMAFAPALEKAIHQLSADLAVYDVDSLAARVEIASTTQRLAGTFVGAFGLLALILAAVGIYGVVAYSARQRTREIGIRMALGADGADVMRLVLGQGMRLTVAGLGLGLGLSLVLTRFLRSELFGISATDPLTFAGVALSLGGVALAACYLPARRAVRVEPTVALRQQ
jgi:predicted permease